MAVVASAESRAAWHERLSLIQIVVTLILAVAGSIGGGYISVRVAQAEQDGRIGVIKAKQEKIEGDIVPRPEHEAHWRAQEDVLRSIQQDVREIRETQRQILLERK